MPWKWISNGFEKHVQRNDRLDYTGLGAQLPQFVQEMQAIEMIYAEDGFAKYRITRDEIHQGQVYTITHHIYFNRDAGGIWEIRRY